VKEVVNNKEDTVKFSLQFCMGRASGRSEYDS